MVSFVLNEIVGSGEVHRLDVVAGSDTVGQGTFDFVQAGMPFTATVMVTALVSWC